MEAIRRVSSTLSHHDVDANKIVDDTNTNQKFDADELRKAAEAAEGEKSMTLAEGWRTHKKAILWSMALSGALIMEGYDVVVIGSFYGHERFLERFGQKAPPGSPNEYLIPAEWQSALSNGSSAGGIIGLLINGWAADRYGPKIVMQVSIIALTCFIFLFVFAQSLTMLVIAEVFCGIPWGVFQTLTTTYASEVCPVQLRGYLTSYVNLCWGAGILLSSGVVKATKDYDSNWSWRLPFVLQWMWVIPLFIIVWFCPMSPWWLVRQGRLEDAEKSLRQLTSAEYVSEQDVKNTVMMMVHTNELEKAIEEGTSYIECFKGIDRRRTEASMMTFAMQLLSGQNLVGQGIQFLQNAGIGNDLSFSLNMVLNAMFMIGTFFSWIAMYFCGRRTIYLFGMGCMCLVLYVIGGLGWVIAAEPTPDAKAVPPVLATARYTSTSYAMGSLLIALNFIYNSSLGPVCYTLIGELSSTRLRQKTIALSRIAYQIMNIICGIIVPRMLSPESWNWGPKSGIFWGTSAFLSTLYIWFRIPETRGRSYGELDMLFEHRVPAWRFKGTKVDQFGQDAINHEKQDLDQAHFTAAVSRGPDEKGAQHIN